MESRSDSGHPSTASDHARFVRGEIIGALEKKRDLLAAEITNYPLPIPVCDEQFDYLLEQRARVTRELSRLRESERLTLSLSECAALLDELVSSSDLITPDIEERIRSYLV